MNWGDVINFANNGNPKPPRRDERSEEEWRELLAPERFYITRLNYWVNGSIKQGSYSFRAGFKKVASVDTVVADKGVTLTCQISREEDTPFILLIAVLFTQWHVTPLKLPDLFPNLNRRQTSTASFFKLLLPSGRKHGRQ